MSVLQVLPITIHTTNLIHVSGLKWIINSILKKILKAGKYGTKGTWNRKPVVFC